MSTNPHPHIRTHTPTPVHPPTRLAQGTTGRNLTSCIDDLLMADRGNTPEPRSTAPLLSSLNTECVHDFSSSKFMTPKATNWQHWTARSGEQPYE